MDYFTLKAKALSKGIDWDDITTRSGFLIDLGLSIITINKMTEMYFIDCNDANLLCFLRYDMFDQWTCHKNSYTKWEDETLRNKFYDDLKISADQRKRVNDLYAMFGNDMNRIQESERANIHLPTTKEQTLVVQKLRELINQHKLFLVDKDSGVIFRADGVVPYGDGFLICNPR
jgi:protein associated with RNAse G/E